MARVTSESFISCHLDFLLFFVFALSARRRRLIKLRFEEIAKVEHWTISMQYAFWCAVCVPSRVLGAEMWAQICSDIISLSSVPTSGDFHKRLWKRGCVSGWSWKGYRTSTNSLSVFFFLGFFKCFIFLQKHKAIICYNCYHFYCEFG